MFGYLKVRSLAALARRLSLSRIVPACLVQKMLFLGAPEAPSDPSRHRALEEALLLQGALDDSTEDLSDSRLPTFCVNYLAVVMTETIV